MFLNTTSFGMAARLAVAAGALLGLGGGGQALAGGPDVNVSIRIGAGGAIHRAPAHHHHDAGTLTIDGRSFRIDAHGSVTEQIRRAFVRMGYDAWCVGRSVRVRIDCHAPEICWRNGEYGMIFRERRTTITLTPEEHCDLHDHGRHYRYGYDHAHGHYFAYSEVQTIGGGVTWSSIGVTTFVDHDHDLDDEIRPLGRTDDAHVRIARMNERRGNAKTVDSRSSVPAPAVRRDDSRPGVEAKPVTREPATKPSDLKRTTSPTPPARGNDVVKALPSDRLDLKRTVTPAAPAKGSDTRPGAPTAKTPAPPASNVKATNNKATKW